MCLCVFIFVQGCAPSRYVKPLARNSQAASFTFGGPVIVYGGAAIPIPFTTAGYARGITNRLTGFVNLHSTSLMFANLQTDIGCTYGILGEEKKFGLSVSPAIQQAFNLRHGTGFRIWPTIDLNAYQVITRNGSYLYAGMNNWFEFSKTRAHGEPQPRHVIPNVHIGFTSTRTKWHNQFEIKYLGPGIPIYPGIIDYKGINSKGSIGLYYSITRLF